MTRTAVVEKEEAGWRVGRRDVLRWGFWGSLGALAVASGAGFVNMLWPRKVTGFGGPIVVVAEDVPKVGDAPKQVVAGRFWLVNLAPDEGRLASDEARSAGGLLALHWKCPHLGCTVPWDGDHVSPRDSLGRRGAFYCNCHGSTYTKSGALVRGPAKRAMDTMALVVAEDGSIIVDTGDIEKGGDDNPRRAVGIPRAQEQAPETGRLT